VSCEAMQESWLEARYVRREPAAEVREHMLGCAQCREFTAEQCALEQLLGQLPEEQAGLGFDTRFFARLEDERKSPTRRSWLRVWLALGPAALAALMLAVHLQKPLQPMASTPHDDVALMRDLDLVEELPLLTKLEEAEAYDALAQATAADLDAVTAERAP